MIEWLARRLIEAYPARRPADFVVGGLADPYLRRWHVLPRNPIFNIYLHQFLRSDDDRALHDHPWMNLSILLSGQYIEHRIRAGGINTRTLRGRGDWALRLLGGIAHRIELTGGPCWTLFITGPVYREWGFHCPDKGWIRWQEFTKPGDAGATGRGCE